MKWLITICSLLLLLALPAYILADCPCGCPGCICNSGYSSGPTAYSYSVVTYPVQSYSYGSYGGGYGSQGGGYGGYGSQGGGGYSYAPQYYSTPITAYQPARSYSSYYSLSGGGGGPTCANGYCRW